MTGTQPSTAGFKGGGIGPRAKGQENTGGFKKLEKARKQALPWGLQKGKSSADILISAERPSPYPDLQNGRIIILCCFNPLGLLGQQKEKKNTGLLRQGCQQFLTLVGQTTVLTAPLFFCKTEPLTLLRIINKKPFLFTSAFLAN